MYTIWTEVEGPVRFWHNWHGPDVERFCNRPAWFAAKLGDIPLNKCVGSIRAGANGYCTAQVFM